MGICKGLCFAVMMNTCSSTPSPYKCLLRTLYFRPKLSLFRNIYCVILMSSQKKKTKKTTRMSYSEHMSLLKKQRKKKKEYRKPIQWKQIPTYGFFLTVPVTLSLTLKWVPISLCLAFFSFLQCSYNLTSPTLFPAVPCTANSSLSYLPTTAGLLRH